MFASSWNNPTKHFSNVLNNSWYNLIFKLSGKLAYATSDYFRSKGYMPALTPVTAGSISSPMGLGSDSEPVQINLFGKPTFLVDSMQFHLEYLLRCNSPGVFYVMPTFRGDSPDKRHLSEFFHIEAEICGSFEDILHLIECYLKFVIEQLLASLTDEINDIVGTTAHMTGLLKQLDTLPRVTFNEAIKMLGNDPGYYKVYNGTIISLTDKAEQALLAQSAQALWVTHLPTLGVPFYQKHAASNTSLCADLLLGSGEIISCGERHATESELLDGMRYCEVDPTLYGWYLRLKREFPLQTAGFGMGLERFLQWIMQHSDIRDMQLFVRQKGIYAEP